jgi:hypothetical protein
MGGTSAIEFKNGLESKAAQASAWNDGMDLKCWVVELNTQGFENLTISSRQQSGGTDPGPKDFKLQYSIETDVWIDIPDGAITVENDWTTSFVDNLPLPVECNDMETLLLRWIMTSNEASGAGGPVLEIGKSKIDDIYVRGGLINGIYDQLQNQIVNIYPNPTSGSVDINAEREIECIHIVSLSGQVVKNLNFNSTIVNLNLSDLPRGTYFMRTKLKGKSTLHMDKVVVL